ncbi:alpha/beta hydrolase [Mycetocola zhadangensis]|uniref:Alpha/beta hydrolase n=1 Tax=Mycetocola zhadangensis TaxID=1164595 RepID=A0A3L7IX82_9MICO|nr:alpha/beta hydrolase [Mycetocola zhadangensis]RLQ82719.1 alpha/beta hydrolase [Mycetocola zhadangensis]GGE98783.1 esterase [Mycetocola zhadangensis]
MDVTVQDDEIDGPFGPVPVRRYSPVAGGSDALAPTVVWLHGGGFFRGSLNQPEADSVAHALARQGYPVVTVDYRLAPLPLLGWLGSRQKRSNRYPVAVGDVLAVVQRLSNSVGDAIVLGGASAGACIAAGAALRYQDEGGKLSGVLLAYGFFHRTHPATMEKGHRPRGHRRFTHSRWALNLMNRNYLGRAPASADCYAFPGGGDLTGFPPTLHLIAERDGMRPSAELFVAELEAVGSSVERHLISGSKHAFLNHPNGNEFATGVELMSQWLNRDAPHERTHEDESAFGLRL